MKAGSRGWRSVRLQECPGSRRQDRPFQCSSERPQEPDGEERPPVYRADKYTCCHRAPNSEGTRNPLTGTFSIFLTTLPGRPSCHRLRDVATELPGGPEPQEPLAATHHVGPVSLKRTPSPSRLLSAAPPRPLAILPGASRAVQPFRDPSGGTWAPFPACPRALPLPRSRWAPQRLARAESLGLAQACFWPRMSLILKTFNPPPLFSVSTCYCNLIIKGKN